MYTYICLIKIDMNSCFYLRKYKCIFSLLWEILLVGCTMENCTMLIFPTYTIKGQGEDICKKNLKTPKGQSKTANRRTDNAVANIKRTRKQTTIYKTLHIKLKIGRHEPD